jgi:hypothetical protein
MAGGEGLPRDRVMLDVARAVLAGRPTVSVPASAPAGWRIRGAAVIGRTALELAVARRLRELTGHPIGTPRVRHQLVCLGELSDGAPWARDAGWAYSALSSACHEHAYELEPNPQEVGHLLDLVERVVEADLGAG